jgi:3,4-dihydroxy 2-butanone 4-phosphate synthase/GTP cyclohydrolase II
MNSPRTTVEEALADIASGRMVVLVDRDSGQSGSELVMGARLATADHLNFMATHGRGLICLALTQERCEELGLDVLDGGERGPRFTLSLDAREVLSHGISSSARARTVQRVLNKDTDVEDLVQPGHVFPLAAHPGGVLERPGHPEAAVDLARLAGLEPAGVICEIVNDDGTTARAPDVLEFCGRHGLKLLAVDDLIAYRRRHDGLLERVVTARMPTSYGAFEVVGYRSRLDSGHHLAFVKGDVAGRDDVLVRVHAECLLGGVFHSLRCECGARLEKSLRMIERAGRGVLVYLVHGAPPVATHGAETPSPDHGVAAEILADLGLNGRKNARISSTTSSGSSSAAKCPPRGISVQRRTS